MTPEQIFPYLLGPFALTVGLLLALYGVTQGWWFTRSMVLRERELHQADLEREREVGKQARQDADYWRRIALAGSSLAEWAKEIAKEKAMQAASRAAAEER